MKKYLTVGLGNFGFNLAAELVENGCEVLGIDVSKENVENAMDFITHAIIGDASNKEVLKSLKPDEYDAVIVSIGQDMAASILIALYLKELGATNIIVRAVSEDHGKILEKLGVPQVIFPEKDMAIKLANKLSMKNVLDYLPMSDDYGIIEMDPPAKFDGKTLKELQIPSKYNCQVIGIKHIDADGKAGFHDTKLSLPSADDIITKDTVLVIIGKYEDLDRLNSR